MVETFSSSKEARAAAGAVPSSLLLLCCWRSLEAPATNAAATSAAKIWALLASCARDSRVDATKSDGVAAEEEKDSCRGGSD